MAKTLMYTYHSLCLFLVAETQYVYIHKKHTQKVDIIRNKNQII